MQVIKLPPICHGCKQRARRERFPDGFERCTNCGYSLGNTINGICIVLLILLIGGALLYVKFGPG